MAPSPSKSRYRSAVPVSTDINNHIHIYLDEGIYISALALLTDLVVPGRSHPNCLDIPAFAPVPLHIEIISTLLVHPDHTTRTPRSERIDLPSRAITFLRSLLEILGPLNANLSEAFSLAPLSRHSRRGRYVEDEGSSDSDDNGTEHLKGAVANEGRIRRSAKGFWHVVGWAFNCSVVYPRRWKYWKVWLDFMLDVLDADWIEREAQDKKDEDFEANSSRDPDFKCEYKKLRTSLLVSYLSDAKGRSAAIKHVIDAAFTDGGTGDLRRYPEVFKDEIRSGTNQKSQKRKRDDELYEGFGNFGNADVGNRAIDSSQSTDSTPEPSQSTEDHEASPDRWLGGAESIFLRQRVLALLSRATATLPECFTGLKDLYDQYCVNLKLVPLPAFSLLVSPTMSSPLPVVAFVSLTQLLQLKLLPNTAPRPYTVSNQARDGLTQEILEKCFLPFAASTSSTEDNAKVSILAENMLRVLLKSVRVYHTPSLDAAIDTGIHAREAKCKGDKRRKERGPSKKAEEDDRKWLIASGKRLRSLLTWVEQSLSDGED